MGIPEEEKERETGGVFKETVAENFPNLRKELAKANRSTKLICHLTI